MSQVWQHSKAGATELLALLAIADFADDNGIAYPSIKTLSEKIRMSERNTQYLIGKLQESGELFVEKNAGPRGCNLFRVQSFQGANIAPVQPVARGGATGSVKGVQPIAPEPSLNHQRTVNKENNKEKSLTKKSRSKKIPLPESFCISDRVRRWAEEKGHTRIDERFEHFVSKAKANAYAYADWDEALMGAIRDDWAKLNKLNHGKPAKYDPAQAAHDDLRRMRSAGMVDPIGDEIFGPLRSEVYFDDCINGKAERVD